MSLKSEFDKRTKGKRLVETELFGALEDAFKAVYGKRCKVEECHGTKYQVEYEYYPFSNFMVRCELCDILLIVEGRYKGEEMTKYTFLQAKRSNFDVPGKGKFRAGLRQHYLLSQFPDVKGVNRSLPKSLLSNHITESIGSFGVFFEEGGGYDMVYSIANNIGQWSLRGATKPVKDNGSRIHRFNDMTRKTQIHKFGVKEYEERLYCKSIDEFQTAVDNMLVGEPLFKCREADIFIQEIIKKIEGLEKEKYPIDYNGAAEIETDEIGCDVILLDLR